MKKYISKYNKTVNQALDLLTQALQIERIGVWELDLRTGSLFFSKELYQIYGLDEDFPINTDMAVSFYSREDQDRIIQVVEEAIQKKQPFDIKCEFFAKDGSRLWVRSKGKCTFWKNKAIKVIGTLQDVTEERNKELDLKKAEDRFWSIAMNTSGWLWEVNQDLIYTYSSQTVESILGYKPSEVLGKSPYDFMDISESEKIQLQLGSILQNHQPIVDLPNWNIKKDGTRVLLLTNGVPFFDSKGLLAGYRGIDRDITINHIIEERARNKESLLREINIARWEYDLLNDVLSWSPGVFDIFEVPHGSIDITFDRFLSFIPVGEREKVESAYRQSLLNRSPYSIVHRIQLGENRFKWVREQCKTVFDEFGRPKHSMGIVQDITELQAVQEELVQQKSYLESIRQSLDRSAIVSITDRSGKIIKVNQRFCKVSGYTEEELLGKRHNIINSGFHSQNFWKAMWKTISQGKTWRREVRNRAKDGSCYWVDTTINPIIDQNGKIIEYLSIRNLITDRKHAEFSLESERKRLQTALNLIDREIEFAINLQDYLLPEPANWSSMGIQVSKCFKPLDRVSGDIYDYFQLSENRLRFFIADATGHGLTAGFQTMSIQTEYQRIKDEFRDPGMVLHSLNQSIYKTFPSEPIFYTAMVIDIDFSDKRLYYSSAGHPEAILIQGESISVMKATNPILGMMKEFSLNTCSVVFEEEFRLVLYTDGITETVNPSMDVFDLDKLLEYLRRNSRLPGGQLFQNLETTLHRFRDGQAVLDDMTMVLVDYKSPSGI